MNDGQIVTHQKSEVTRKIAPPLLFVVIIIIAYYFFVVWRDGQDQRDDFFVAVSDTLRKIERSDDPTTTNESLKNLEEAIRNATTPQEEAWARTNAALGYIFVWDLEKAVDVLKHSITDANTAYTDTERGLMLVRLLSIYSLSYDQELARTRIFVGGDPWETFMANGSVEEAVRLAYEWATDLLAPGSPTPRYYIALWYADQLYRGALDAETKNRYIQEFERYISEADVGLPPWLAASHVHSWEKGFMLSVKGTVYANIYYALGREDYKKKAEEAFKQGLAYLSVVENLAEKYQIAVTVRVQFNYARFLAYLTVNDVEDRSTDLAALVKEMMQTYQVYEPFYMRNIAILPPTESVTLQDTTRIVADLEPEFKEFLIRQGWAF